MRVLVCGGRTYDDYSRMREVLDGYDIDVLIHGGARGADTCAMHYAGVNRIKTECYRAEWDKFGKSAGPIRNRKMLEKGKPDVVVTFPGGRGTANMIELARERGVRTESYR